MSIRNPNPPSTPQPEPDLTLLSAPLEQGRESCRCGVEAMRPLELGL